MHVWFRERYLTATEWTAILDPATTWETVVRLVVRRLEIIGCVWPSEHTALLVWCIFITARCPVNHPVFYDCDTAFLMKCEVMTAAKQNREHMLEFPVGAGDCVKYPPNVAEFKLQYPHIAERAFTESLKEMMPQVDERVLYQTKSNLPCRTNHRGMAPAKRSYGRSKARTVHAAASGLRTQRSWQDPRDDDEIPGLVIYGNHRPVQGGRAALPASGAALASAAFGVNGGVSSLSSLCREDGSQSKL